MHARIASFIQRPLGRVVLWSCFWLVVSAGMGFGLFGRPKRWSVSWPSDAGQRVEVQRAERGLPIPWNVSVSIVQRPLGMTDTEAFGQMSAWWPEMDAHDWRVGSTIRPWPAVVAIVFSILLAVIVVVLGALIERRRDDPREDPARLAPDRIA